MELGLSKGKVKRQFIWCSIVRSLLWQNDVEVDQRATAEKLFYLVMMRKCKERNKSHNQCAFTLMKIGKCDKFMVWLSTIQNNSE